MIRLIKLSSALGLLVLLCASCNKHHAWVASETILLNDVSPIGISAVGNQIWISDGNNNRLVQIDRTGQSIGDPIEIERPMHIASTGDLLYIPSYGIDQILIMSNNAIDTLTLQDSLDAPAAVDISGDHIAIADFYNHRVLLKSGEDWQVIGGKGKGVGQMTYPTDVQFHEGRLYVADAYNNRGQVFDKEGSHIMTFGEDQNFNAATGIFITDKNIILTDFEHDRVVIFNHKGRVKQILSEGLSKPADVTVIDDKLWVLNFAGKYISTYVNE